MSDQNAPVGQRFDDELRYLKERLEELRAKGIISGGEGPRYSLKPTARAPGALARFLADGR